MVAGLLKEMNLQVFVGQETPEDEIQMTEYERKINTEKNYVLLVCDIIYYLYCYSVGKDIMLNGDQPKTLVNRMEVKPQNLSK